MRSLAPLFLLLLSPTLAHAEGPLPALRVGGPLLFSLARWWAPPRALASPPVASVVAATGTTRAPLPAGALRKLQRAAWRSAGLDAVDRERMASRARRAALLPELRVRGMKSNDQSLRYTPLNEEDLRAQATGHAGMLYEVRLDFHLERLLFSQEEVAIERLWQEQQQQRQRVTQRLSELLAVWHRSRELAGAEGRSEEERAEAEGAVLAAEEALDLLTDGAWSALKKQE